LPFVVPLPESRPREVASGIGLICRRGGSESSPPATINNLVIGA
jgi:hypothetical protein